MADSDYSVSDKSEESDSDSSDHLNTNTVQLKENNSSVSLRRSTRKKEVPFVSFWWYLTYMLVICSFFRCINQTNIFYPSPLNLWKNLRHLIIH